MRLVLVAEALGSHDGWASASQGLLEGLLALGARARVLLDYRAAAAAPPGAVVIPCLSSPLGALDRPRSIAWNAAQLARHSRGADLVHFMVEPYANSTFPPGLPPTFITVHGTFAVSPFKAGRLTRRLYGAALRRARRVICASRFTRDALAANLPLDNLQVIHHGHDLLAADGAVGPDAQLAGSPIIVGVGALKERKGYHVALRAVARLKDRFPELRYYLIGDDADRKYVARLRDDIATLRLERHAIIHGPVPHAQLPVYYRQADLFMLTPIVVEGSHFEGFGIVYLEAGSSGKPVIGSYGCGSAEAVEDGVNGLLAPQHDDAAIAEKATDILGDPALAARLGAAGRAKAERQTWANVARQYLDVYEASLAH